MEDLHTQFDSVVQVLLPWAARVERRELRHLRRSSSLDGLVIGALAAVLAYAGWQTWTSFASLRWR